MLLSLVWLVACSDEDQSGLGGKNTATGGTASTTTDPSANGGAATTGGNTQLAAAGGSTGNTTTGSDAGASSVAPPMVTTRCGDSTTGEVTLTHTPSSGQTNTIAGTTSITAGSLSSFSASELDLQFCFSVVGSVALTLTSGIIIDSASISGGGVNYVNLAGTALSLESTNEHNRYCIVFDVSAAAGASDVAVSGAAAVTYNWRFTEKSVDVGLLFDPRAKSAPELKAILNGNVAACQVVSS